MRGATSRNHKPRELRHRVIAAARMRRPRGWCDATILNISSRGLQIQTSWPLDEGSWVELRRGDHVIRAQVIWYKGVRAGLRSDDLLAVEEIAIGEAAPVLCTTSDRPRHRRSDDSHRLLGRAVEFGGVVTIAVLLAFGVFSDFQEAFARPMAMVAAALR